MTLTQTSLRRPDSAVDLLRVGWDRAWAFTPLLRRDSRRRVEASRSWTWQWVVVAWQAVCLLPWLLPAVGSAARYIWMIDGASAEVRPLRPDLAARRPRGVALVCTVAFAGNVSILVAGWSVSVLTASIGWRVGLLLWLLPITLLLLHNAGAAIGRWSRGSRTGLRARLADAAGDRPGYVLAEMAATRSGTGRGRLLLQQIQTRWDAENAVGILRAGSGDLVGYYRHAVRGWVLAGGADRSLTYGAGGGH